MEIKRPGQMWKLLKRDDNIIMIRRGHRGELILMDGQINSICRSWTLA